MTDYQHDLEAIDRDAAELQNEAKSGSLDKQQITRLAYRIYQRAALTGRPDDFVAAEAAINAAFQQISAWPDLCLLKAHLDMKLHRLVETKYDLDLAPGLAGSFAGRVVWADIHLQEGRYQEAKQSCEALIAENRTWDLLARLAFWESKFGDINDALRLYTEAEDEITAKEMRGYAWVQLQKGLIALRAGRFDEAAEHYHRAGQSYSGYWLVDDHMAELLATEGRYDEAVKLYKGVIEATPKPELHQAFGELYTAMGSLDDAEKHFDAALQGFLTATDNGGIQYYHHLVDFFSDVRENGPEAVHWARKDYDLRRNYATEGALGWALYRDDQIDEALEMMTRALASGVKDAHLFAKAATVEQAAGNARAAEDLTRRAFALNPHHQGFHVHRS